MRQKNTCQFCTEQYEGCHGKCEKYLEAVREHEELKELIKKNKQKYTQFDTFKIDAMRKARRKKK